MDTRKLCETCPLSEYDEGTTDPLVQYCWKRFLINPRIAQVIMVRLSQQAELIPEQLYVSDARFSEEVIRAAAQNRQPVEAVTDCFLRHNSGECSKSVFYAPTVVEQA